MEAEGELELKGLLKGNPTLGGLERGRGLGGGMEPTTGLCGRGVDAGVAEPGADLPLGDFRSLTSSVATIADGVDYLRLLGVTALPVM